MPMSRAELRRSVLRHAVADVLFTGALGTCAYFMGQMLTAAGWPAWARLTMCALTGVPIGVVYVHALVHWVRRPVPGEDRGGR